MARRIVVEFLGKDTSAGATADHVGGKFDKLGSKFAKVGLVAGAALAGGAVVAGKALFDMAKGAAEDEAAQKKLATALQNNAGATKQQVAATEDWITAQGKALGVADDDLRPALGKLVAATHDVGKSQRLASLAMDVSAGSGKSLDSVTTALAKAQHGNVAGLAKLGVATKNADGSTRSLNDITKDLAKTYAGQASAAANTTEGKWKRLKLQFDEAKETIGSKLLPIGAKLADFLLNKMGPAAQRVGEWCQKNLLPPLRDFAEAIAPKVRDLMEKVKKAFADAQPFFELVGKVFMNVLMPAFKKAAELWLPYLGLQFEILGKAVGALGKMATWLWNNAFAPMIRLLLNGFAMMTSGWALVLGALGHIPGFGWAKDAAAKMSAAADQARRLANNISDIQSKEVKITVRYATLGVVPGPAGALLQAAQSASNYKPPKHATGTRGAKAGFAVVGEHGRELVKMAGGEQVFTAQQTRSILSGDGGGGSFVVQLKVGAKVIEQVLIEHVRSTGRPLQVRTLGPA